MKNIYSINFFKKNHLPPSLCPEQSYHWIVKLKTKTKTKKKQSSVHLLLGVSLWLYNMYNLLYQKWNSTLQNAVKPEFCFHFKVDLGPPSKPVNRDSPHSPQPLKQYTSVCPQHAHSYLTWDRCSFCRCGDDFHRSCTVTPAPAIRSLR